MYLFKHKKEYMYCKVMCSNNQLKMPSYLSLWRKYVTEVQTKCTSVIWLFGHAWCELLKMKLGVNWSAHAYLQYNLGYQEYWSHSLVALKKKILKVWRKYIVMNTPDESPQKNWRCYFLCLNNHISVLEIDTNIWILTRPSSCNKGKWRTFLLLVHSWP